MLPLPVAMLPLPVAMLPLPVAMLFATALERERTIYSTPTYYSCKSISGKLFKQLFFLSL